jgi:hypothetical protein
MAKRFPRSIVAAIEESKILGVRATAASREYVRGFRTPRRRATTVEFVPR